MRFPFRQTISVAKYIYSQKNKGTKRFPLVLMLEPLHACNLKCSGCGRIREYKDVLSKMLSLDDCIKASDDCNAPVVSICGGEPLLYHHIIKLVDKLLKKGRVVYLCTNGQILKDKLPLFQPHHMFNINVHLDGLKQTHDIVVEKSGAFDKAMEGIKEALKLGFTVCTNTTIYKQTDVKEIKSFIKEVGQVGVNGILLSPGYSYEDVDDQSIFLTQEESINIFRQISKETKGKKVWSTPLYLDFLEGKRELDCTPWGNVTYNVKGWKAPCYLITDKHFDSYSDFITSVDWNNYGPQKDKRCRHCMVHSGFEATVALKAGASIKDALRMAMWTFL